MPNRVDSNSNFLPTVYQSFIYKSRYSKYIPELNRREEWDETIARYFNFFQEFLKDRHNYDLTQDRKALEDSVLNLEIMPSMRGLMTAGAALKRDEAAIYNCSYFAVDSLRTFDEEMYTLMLGTGVGFSVENHDTIKLPIISETFYESDTVIVVEDSRIGWSKAFKELLVLLSNGQIPKYDVSKLRPKGARLKTFGGRASGPAPLVDLFEFSINMFKRAAGRKLTSVELHDLACKVADIVVVGGVRRCLPDGSMVHSRHGLVPIEQIQIGDEVLTSNGYHKVTNKFDQGVQELVTVKTQDSSFRCTPNHKIAVLTAIDEYTWKMAKDLEPNDRIIAPSVSLDGTDVELPEFSYIKPKHSTTCKDIIIPKLTNDIAWLMGYIQGDGYVELTQKSGGLNIPFPNNQHDFYQRVVNIIKLFGIEHHSLIKYDNYFVAKFKSKQLATYFHSWLKQPNTELIIPECIMYNTRDIKLSYVAGLMDSDGAAQNRPVQVLTTIYKNFAENIRLLLSSCGIQARNNILPTSCLKENWKPKFSVSLINNNGKELLDQYTMKEIRIRTKESFTNSYPVPFIKGCHVNVPWSKTIGKLIPVTVNDVIYNGETEHTWDIEVENMHEFFCEGYLMHNSALISLSDLTDERMRTAKTGEWWNTTPHRRLANNSAVYKEKPDIGTFMREWTSLYESKSGERGIFSRAAAKKVIDHSNNLRKQWFGEDTLVRDTNYDFGCNPCSEIILRSHQFCNLTSVQIRPTDDIKSLKQKVVLATILGTFQSCLTNFRYLSKKWEKNTKEERLLGVSLNGIFDNALTNGKMGHDKLIECLTELRKVAIETNKKWAAILGINESTAITCVKPEGTSSALNATSSGIHPAHSPYYIRYVRNDKKDPLTSFLIDVGIPYEEDVYDPNNMIAFKFPMKSSDDAICRNDITAIEHLELWKTYQEYYCEHKPSVTISVKEHEWMDVGAWVYNNFEWMSGVSFLPYSEHIYKQAPFTDCNKEQYEELLKITPTSVDWSKLVDFEKEDTTTSTQELACVAGGCAI